MNEIPVNAHVSEARLHRDRFVRHHPNRAAADLIHFHGKTHRGVDGTDSPRLELSHNFSADLVDLITCAMELQVRNRPRSSANRLASHSHDDTQQRFRPRIISQDLLALALETWTREFH